MQAKAGEASKLSLAVGLPWGEVPEGGVEAARAAYAGYASLVSPPEGYDFALDVDVAKLPADDEGRDGAAEKLACVRLVLTGAKLRGTLGALAEGTSAEAKTFQVPHRPNEAFFVAPKADTVTVVFPMRFKDHGDATIAHTFLQQFVEARRQPALNLAPGAAWSKTPPLELQGCDPDLAHGANGGYVTFLIEKRHVKGERLDKAVWGLLTFYAFVAYHIKCSKAYMHSSMRKRTAGLLQVLNRAKPETEKAKKTAQGRTFVRKA